jgi:2-methylcitrate dehydratase PrpD
VSRLRQSFSSRLAAHVACSTFAQLRPATVHAARRALLDGVGVMLAASGLAPEVRPFVEIATRDGGRPEATILGTGERVNAAQAAFANGAMAHALDYEDAFDRAPVHPNASSLPAVIALAEANGTTHAGELLTAIAVGCDLACRLGLAAGAPLQAAGWYPPPILGGFGAVAAAGRLLRLDERRILDAWSLLLLQNSAPAQIAHSADSVVRGVREAFPARAAVECVQLAALGVRGFDAPFEGRGGLFAAFARDDVDTTDAFAGIGERWLIEDLSFKPWPCCRGTHAAVELALELRAHVGSGPDAISEVVVRGGSVQAMLAEPLARKQSPTTATDAKFSLPFTVATALVHGVVDFDSFSPAALRNDAVLALAARVRFEERPDWPTAQATSGQLWLRLSDGREFRGERLEPRGSPLRPLDDSTLICKFVDCAARAAKPWPEQKALAVAAGLLALRETTPLVGPLDAWVSRV